MWEASCVQLLYGGSWAGAVARAGGGVGRPGGRGWPKNSAHTFSHLAAAQCSVGGDYHSPDRVPSWKGSQGGDKFIYFIIWKICLLSVLLISEDFYLILTYRM